MGDEGQSSATMSPSGAKIHRIYDGTPEKVSKRKLMEISSLEKLALFKAKRVTITEVESVLAADEDLITYRQIRTEQEKRSVLAEVFSPEVVVVVEALFLQQEFFDVEFLSLSVLREFSKHLDVLLLEVAVEEKPSFSRFCSGLWHTMQKEHDGISISVSKGKATSKRILAMEKAKERNQNRAAIAVGVKLFKAVGEAVTDSNPKNSELMNVCSFSISNLEAWVELYKKKQDRHISSHPFKFICGNVQKAYNGLAVLEFVQDSKEYEILSPLIKAAIPQVLKAIKDKEAECGKQKEERGMQRNVVRSLLMGEINDIMEEFGTLDI